MRGWNEGYRPMNEALARAVVEEARRDADGSPGSEAGEGSIILLQDYHLYLAAALVRASLPEATIEQFIHIPWPANRYWRCCCPIASFMRSMKVWPAMTW